ncbi:MAG: hypothetical protein H6739_33525 [Alphaproteobacteria bacterium]|nr:hypothetical protein [Alphaproteobacteria bacterium]
MHLTLMGLTALALAQEAPEEAPETPIEATADEPAEAPAEVPTQACEPYDLDTQVDLAIVELNDDALEDAERLAADAITHLPCLPRVADPDDLASLWQVRGAAAIYGGRPEAAGPFMRQAAALYPGYFNERLGGQAQQAWAEAGEGLSGEGTIEAWPIPDDGVLYVNGQAREEQPVALLPGDHFVQVAVGAEVLYAQIVPLADTDAILLETALPEPRRISWPLTFGILSGLGAAGAYTGAVLLDRQLTDAANSDQPETLRAYRAGSVGLGYAATPLLIAGAASGIVIHVRNR